MDIKLIEDLLELQRHGSFVQAAQARHVTHPAFGRRIRSLEAWAGVALVQSARSPIRLTPAGEALLEQAQPFLEALLRMRAQWQARSRDGGPTGHSLRIGTGRTLAHTWVADWLASLHAVIRDCRVDLRTSAMAEIAKVFERGEVDFLVCYEHPALSVGLSGQRFRHYTLAHDRLLPVSRADAQGRARHELGSARWIDYAPTLALGRLLEEHRGPTTTFPPPVIVCDSADAMLELVLKGVGLAWLPRSLVAQGLRQGLLKALGGKADQIQFEVRLYRHRARQAPSVEAVWDATTR